MTGKIHLYTGNGKGKTTAALGLSLRAMGAGKKVFFAQFVKGKTYSEIDTIEKHLPGIVVKQYGLGCFIVNSPTQKDVDAARQGLAEVSEMLVSGDYDMVVMDEACIAIYYQLFSAEELVDALNKRKEETEVIITGRYAPDELIEIADLVTEMKEVKHYYNDGLEARKGVEF
ncbi:MAG: cob(I)yrinic acid a,c-diamide adenosyltransferase [Bacteroidales bacterium]|nr:cob(I)yrinic acid a,c-diamide adenosyltransferase [Bacteroidales bacterium]